MAKIPFLQAGHGSREIADFTGSLWAETMGMSAVNIDGQEDGGPYRDLLSTMEVFWILERP